MSHIKYTLTSSLLGQLLKKSGSETGSDKYDCSRLSRSPVGGSFVILTPFCRMVTGNWYQRECFYFSKFVWLIRIKLHHAAEQIHTHGVELNLGWRIACEPKAEVWVACRWTEVLTNFLKAGQPGNSQVTVLQTHPCAILHCCGYHFGSDGSLALPQWDGLELGTTHILVTRKFE